MKPDRYRPLEALINECAGCLRRRESAHAPSCCELLRRVLEDGNDAAWDALVPLLWLRIHRWIYAMIEDVPPAEAERLCVSALARFRAELITRADNHSELDSFSDILQSLLDATREAVMYHLPENHSVHSQDSPSLESPSSTASDVA